MIAVVVMFLDVDWMLKIVSTPMGRFDLRSVTPNPSIQAGLPSTTRQIAAPGISSLAIVSRMLRRSRSISRRSSGSASITAAAESAPRARAISAAAAAHPAPTTNDLRVERTTVDSALRPRAVPLPQVQELPPRPRAVRDERRIRSFRVSNSAARDSVAFGLAPEVGGRKLVRLGGIQAKHLGAQRRRHLRVAVLLAQLVRDLERAERLDLVLRRAVPDRVRAPQHVVLADVLEQLAHRVCGRGWIAHRQETPGRAELRIHVAVRLHARVQHRGDQRIDAVGALRIVRALVLTDDIAG